MNSQKIITTGVCIAEALDNRRCPKKVKICIEKPGDTFCLPGRPRYKQVGLFTFQKVKGGHGPLRCTSHVASLDMDRLLKAQWSSSDARLKVSVKRRQGKKDTIFLGLLDFLNHLVTVDCEAEKFVLHVREGKVHMKLVHSLPEEDERKADKDENQGEEGVSNEQCNDDGSDKEDNLHEQEPANHLDEMADTEEKQEKDDENMTVLDIEKEEQNDGGIERQTDNEELETLKEKGEDEAQDNENTEEMNNGNTANETYRDVGDQQLEKKEDVTVDEDTDETSDIYYDCELEVKESIVENEEESTSEINEVSVEEQSNGERCVQETDEGPDHYENTENCCLSEEDRKESVDYGENAMESDEFVKESEKEVAEVIESDMTEHRTDDEEKKETCSLKPERRDPWGPVKRFVKRAVQVFLVLFVTVFLLDPILPVPDEDGEY